MRLFVRTALTLPHAGLACPCTIDQLIPHRAIGAVIDNPARLPIMEKLRRMNQNLPEKTVTLLSVPF